MCAGLPSVPTLLSSGAHAQQIACKNHAQGFFEQNILETLAYVEAAAENSTTIPLYIIEGIVSNIT